MRVHLLLSLIALASAGGLAAADELLTVAGVEEERRAADTVAAAVTAIAARWSLDPGVARVLAGLPPARLAEYDDEALRALAGALMPRDDAQRLALAFPELTAGLLRHELGAQTGLASGGIRARLEGLRVAADQLRWELVERAERLVPAHIVFSAGPDGPWPERVLVDTRATHFASCNFRGVLAPAACEVAMLPPGDGAVHTPDQVRWRIILPELGAFHGLLRGPDGWAPVRGRADRMEAVAVAERVDGRLVQPRLTELVLHGRPDAPAILQLRVDGSAGLEDVQSHSSRITLTFTADGAADTLSGGGTSRSYPVLADGSPTAPAVPGLAAFAALVEGEVE